MAAHLFALIRALAVLWAVQAICCSGCHGVGVVKGHATGGAGACYMLHSKYGCNMLQKMNLAFYLPPLQPVLTVYQTDVILYNLPIKTPSSNICEHLEYDAMQVVEPRDNFCNIKNANHWKCHVISKLAVYSHDKLIVMIVLCYLYLGCVFLQVLLPIICVIAVKICIFKQSFYSS